MGSLDFNRNNGPNVRTNPLSNHIKSNVNAIMEDSNIKVKTKVDEVKASMEDIYKVLVRVRAILRKEAFDEEKRKQDCFYQYHAACMGHTIQNCEEFRRLI